MTRATDSAQRFPRGACLLLSLAAMAVYSPMHAHGFVGLDDTYALLINTRIHDGLTWSNILWAFTTTYYDYWHPLPWLSHLFDIELYGLSAGGHYLTSLVLHAANVALLFSFVWLISRRMFPSVLAGALFAVHPLHVESVAWLVERKDLLYTMFWYVSVICYVHFARGRGWTWYGASLTAFCLSLMSKPMAVTLPAVLLILDWWPLGRFRAGNRPVGPTRGKAITRVLLEKLPFAVLALAAALATYLTVSSIGSLSHSIPLMRRLGVALEGVLWYLGKFLWPAGLGVLHPFRAITSVWGPVGALALLAAATGTLFVFRRRAPAMLAGWLWFLFTLVPVSGIVHTGFQSTACRFVYVPLAGIYIGLGITLNTWLEHRGHRTRVAVRAAVAAWCLVLVPVTLRQLSYWHDGIALFEHTIRVTGPNPKANAMLGTLYRRAGEPQRAIEAYSRALDQDSGLAEAYHGRGVALMVTGRAEHALPDLRTAVSMAPRDTTYLLALGQALQKAHHHPEALSILRQAAATAPHWWKPWSDMGISLQALDSLDNAEVCFRRAIALEADAAAPYVGLGRLLLKRSRPAEAVPVLLHAVTREPTSPVYASDAAVALMRTGRFGEARDLLQAALSVDPDCALARRNLQRLDDMQNAP